jgi:hypothetical protein
MNAAAAAALLFLYHDACPIIALYYTVYRSRHNRTQH